MDKIIAQIVGIILVLGLIAYAILSQVSGIKDVGDKAAIEQQKINMILEEPDVVTGHVVKKYYDQGYDIFIQFFGESKSNEKASDDEIERVKAGALFTMEKKYDENGELRELHFQQKDLSSK